MIIFICFPIIAFNVHVMHLLNFDCRKCIDEQMFLNFEVEKFIIVGVKVRKNETCLQTESLCLKTCYKSLSGIAPRNFTKNKCGNDLTRKGIRICKYEVQRPTVIPTLCVFLMCLNNFYVK